MRDLLVIAVAASCGGATAPEVALPDVVTHPLYRVRAELPAGWVAEAAHASIYPADSWSLHPAGTQGPPAVTLILGWLPRGGRQSAYFPGGRDEDARSETREIGGARRGGMVEGAGRTFLADFDVGELAVSIRTAAADDASRAVVDAIVAHLAFDLAARPSDHPRPARRALDLVRTWATSRGYATDNIVFVGAPPGTGTFAFTLFDDRGLVSLQVDAAVTTVTEMPL